MPKTYGLEVKTVQQSLEIRIPQLDTHTHANSANDKIGCVAALLPNRIPETIQQTALTRTSETNKMRERPKRVSRGILIRHGSENGRRQVPRKPTGDTIILQRARETGTSARK